MKKSHQSEPEILEEQEWGQFISITSGKELTTEDDLSSGKESPYKEIILPQKPLTIRKKSQKTKGFLFTNLEEENTKTAPEETPSTSPVKFSEHPLIWSLLYLAGIKDVTEDQKER